MPTNVRPGATDVSLLIHMSTEGGLDNETIDFGDATITYRKSPRSAAVTITPANLGSAVAAHSDGAFGHVAAGVYRLDLPDAAVPAAGQTTYVEVVAADAIQTAGPAEVATALPSPPAGATHQVTLPATTFAEAAANLPVAVLVDDTTLANLIGVSGGELTLIDESGAVPDHRAGYSAVVVDDFIKSYFEGGVGVYDAATQTTIIAGYAMQTATWYAVEFSHRDRTTRVVTLATGVGTFSDDHASPGMSFNRTTGVWLLHAATHDASAGRLWRRSAAGVWTEIGYGLTVTQASYVEADVNHEDADTAKHWFIYREGTSGGRPRRILFSEDDGATWTAPVDLVNIASQRPYIRAVSDGVSKIHVVYSTTHPDEIAYGSSDLYHGYLDTSNNKLYTSDGTEIGDLGSVAFNTSNGTKVVDDATSNSWPMDIVVDGDTVQFVYARHYAGAYGDLVDYRAATWDGVAWSDNLLIATPGSSLYGPNNSNQGQYLPGLCQLALDDFLASVESEGTLEMRRYYLNRTTGAVWYDVVSESCGVERIRPFAVRDGHADLRAGWCDGHYARYLDTGSNPTSTEMALVTWPRSDWAVRGRALITLEATVDGLSDRNFYLVPSRVSPRQRTATPSDAAMLFSGDCNSKILASGAAMAAAFNTAASFWAVIGFTPHALAGNPHNNYLASNYSATTAEGHFILRLNSAGQLSVVVNTNTGGVKALVATDITPTLGVPTGIAVAYDPTNGIRAYALGVKSSVTTAGGSGHTLFTTSATKPLMSGTSPHDAKEWEAEMWLLALGTGVKDDAWGRMASLAAARSAETRILGAAVSRLSRDGSSDLAAALKAAAYTAPLDAAQTAAAILQTPTNKLATDAAGAIALAVTDGDKLAAINQRGRSHTTTIAEAGGGASEIVLASYPTAPAAYIGSTVKVGDVVSTIVAYDAASGPDPASYTLADELDPYPADGAAVVVYSDALEGADAAVAGRLPDGQSEIAAAGATAKTLDAVEGSGGGGPATLDPVDEGYLVGAARKQDGVFVCDAPIYLDVGETPLCGVSIDHWRPRARFAAMEAPASSDEDVVTVSAVETTGYGAEPTVAKFRPQVAAGAAPGATAQISFFATTGGGRQKFVVDVIKRRV